MNIRPARVQDGAAIAAITNDIVRDTLITFTTAERTIASIVADIETRGARFLVAEAERQVLGFATYGPFRAGPGYARCCEHSIQLVPQARGHGTGRALMSGLETQARKEDIHVMVAGISSANPTGIAFHSAIGFSEVGRMPEVGFKWGKWLDLVLMQKILAQD